MVILQNKQDKRTILNCRIFTYVFLVILLISVTACESDDGNPDDLSLLDLFIGVVNNLRYRGTNDIDSINIPDPGESGSVESAQSEGYLEDDTMLVSPVEPSVPNTGPETSVDDLRNKPVGFVNYGIFDATVRAATYTPLGALEPQISPPPASTVSTAKPPSGTWPNTSRFITVPLGSYTWCIDWEEGDVDEDGSFDYYHYYTEEPTLLDYDDSDELDFAEEVAISAPPDKGLIYKGKCSDLEVEASCYGKTTYAQSFVKHVNQEPVYPLDFYALADTAYREAPDGIDISFSSSSGNWYGSKILYTGDWIEATTSDPYTAMGVQVFGDQTIGYATVYFDGNVIWAGDTSECVIDPNENNGLGWYGIYVEVLCFPAGTHTLRVEAGQEKEGVSGWRGGVPVHLFGFRR